MLTTEKLKNKFFKAFATRNAVQTNLFNDLLKKFENGEESNFQIFLNNELAQAKIDIKKLRRKDEIDSMNFKINFLEKHCVKIIDDEELLKAALLAEMEIEKDYSRIKDIAYNIFHQDNINLKVVDKIIKEIVEEREKENGIECN